MLGREAKPEWQSSSVIASFKETLLKINRKSKFKKKNLDDFLMECLNAKNVEKNMMEVMDLEDFVQNIVEEFILENV